MSTTQEDALAFVRGFIAQTATLAELAELETLVAHARRGRTLTLAPGTRVMTGRNLSPKYLAGLTGTVKGYDRGKLLFEPDIPQPRYGNPMRLPAGTVVPI